MLTKFHHHTEKEAHKSWDLMDSLIVTEGGQSLVPAAIKPVVVKLEKSVTSMEKSTINIDKQMPNDWLESLKIHHQEKNKNSLMLKGL